MNLRHISLAVKTIYDVMEIVLLLRGGLLVAEGPHAAMWVRLLPANHGVE